MTNLLKGLSREEVIAISAAANRSYEAYAAKHYRPADPKTIKVGDRLSWYDSRYQHDARVIVTKVNDRSIIAYEVEGSYQAGCRWTLHKEWPRWDEVRKDSSFNDRGVPSEDRHGRKIVIK